MARIAGVNIPTAKRVHIALTYIHGIGRRTAKEICESAGIDEPIIGELIDQVAAASKVVRRAVGGSVVVVSAVDCPSAAQLPAIRRTRPRIQRRRRPQKQSCLSLRCSRTFDHG